MSDPLTPQEERRLLTTLARANERLWGIAAGVLGAMGLLVATLILVIRGGPNPGPHLSLLSAYFPGYSVTGVGSLVGFIYGFVVGYAVGRTVAAIYNRLSR